jgi:uncharacterized protein YvpB
VLGWVALAATLLFSSGDAHVLDVPYRNQLDGSAYALANCGPTSVSMALAYYGVDASPWDLRVKSMKAQHSWVTDDGGYSDRYGVFVYNLATVVENEGLHADGLWSHDGWRSDRLHVWQTYEIKREILADHPVIVQVEYRALPRHARSRAPDDHYIVVHGMVGDEFVYSDPLDGADLQISPDELSGAMGLAQAPGAGFAVVKGR